MHQKKNTTERFPVERKHGSSRGDGVMHLTGTELNTCTQQSLVQVNTCELEICETENALDCSGLQSAGMFYIIVALAANTSDADVASQRLS